MAIFKKTKPTGASVSVGRDNKGLINTGVIKDSNISIDAKSFERFEFEGKAGFFESVNSKFPFLWALRNCINQLQIKSQHEYCEILHDPMDGESITTVSIKNLSEGQSIEVLLFIEDESTIGLSTVVRILKPLIHTYGKLSDIKLIINRQLESSVKSFFNNGLEGQFSSKFFRRSKEKHTGLPVSDIEKIFKKLNIETLEEYYARNIKGVSVSNDIRGSISDVFKAIVVHFSEKADRLKAFRVDPEYLYLRLGAEHKSELLPALPKFESLAINSLRAEQKAILKNILSDESNAIVHALGGVGKTVTARLFKDALPHGSIAILYDCFGDGLYRSMNSPRHSENIVLKQIANELALLGLCEPLIDNATSISLISEFSQRIEDALSRIRVQDKQAQLFIFIDAADNAVMAARERSESTIVTDLINRLHLEGCKVVGFCRTERRSYLELNATIKQYELSPFNLEESFNHLKTSFPLAKDDDGIEFHRLSGGNPRVQATAISYHIDSLTDVMQELGPTLSTVDQQIESQLNNAILRLKQKNVEGEAEKIDLICTALASLPPFIPIDVLALITDFEEANIKSFISDIGRGLLLLDDTVQFRDEPTESWFRETFTTTPQQASSFVEKIESLAYKNSYIAESLPFLMSHGGNIQALIDLALSEDFLPTNNPIDARSISNSRLKFALQAAIRNEMFVDVAKLLMRTGEESAGDDRQFSLLADNVTLVSDIQSPTEVQKLAFKGQLSSNWKGSGNLYKASLLSRFAEYRGEAIMFLRAAEKWLDKYFDEKKENEDNNNQEESLTDTDITEICFVYLNLFGIEKTVKMLLSWSPKEAMYSVIQGLASRLYTSNRQKSLQELVDESSKHPYICIHFVECLYELEQNIDKSSLMACASQLLNPIEAEVDAQVSLPATLLVSFIECCYSHSLDLQLLREIASRYLNIEPKSWWGENIRHDSDWVPFIKSEAIRSIVNDEDFNIESVLPKSFGDSADRTYKEKQEIESYKKLVGATIPLEVFRIKIRANRVEKFDEELTKVKSQSKSYYSPTYYDGKVLDNYIEGLLFSILLRSNMSPDDKGKEIEKFLKNELKLSYSKLVSALSITTRVKRHNPLVDKLEEGILSFKTALKKEDPDSFSKFWIDLAKAILPQGRSQASTYFNNAIEAASKYGHEALSRFMAIMSFAKQGGEANDELVYRFARCAELIGEEVREKHFPRADALNIMHDMHPSSAFSVMARWLDREVIYMGRIQPYLMNHAAKSNTVSGPAAWASTGFLDWYPFTTFLSSCIGKTSEHSIQKAVFEDAITQALLKELDYSELSQLFDIGQQIGLSDARLDLALESKAEPDEQSHQNRSDDGEITAFDWDSLFSDSPIMTHRDILALHRRFSEIEDKPTFTEFWREFYSRKTTASGTEVLEEISKCAFDSEYDLEIALEEMPQRWFEREAIEEKWEELFCMVVERKHAHFANPWWHHWGAERYPDIGRIKKLRNLGVLSALKKNLYSSDPESLFSLATVIAENLTSEESKIALDYALSRFELHVDADDADGDWSEQLAPYDSTSKSYCAFIMSALANPSSEIRWQAVHTVRRLVQLNCSKEIKYLFDLYHLESIGAYGASQFPYYKFYAQMFFLIGVYRGSIDNPQMIAGYKEQLLNIALKGDHILIEKLASDTCINVDKKCAEVFSKVEIDSLTKVSKSQLTVKTIERSERVSRLRDHKGPPRERREISFFMNFEEYWLIPLKNYFDVSLDDLKNLVSDIAIKEWGFL